MDAEHASTELVKTVPTTAGGHLYRGLLSLTLGAGLFMASIALRKDQGWAGYLEQAAFLLASMDWMRRFVEEGHALGISRTWMRLAVLPAPYVAGCLAGLPCGLAR